MKEEMEQNKRDHEAHIANIIKTSQDKYNGVHVKNVSVQDELKHQKIANGTLMPRIALTKKQCEDEISSATSSSFSRCWRHLPSYSLLRSNWPS